MKINKAINTKRNIIAGTILRVYELAAPFAIRTVMMYTIGVQYLGLNSLFTSILQVLNLAELGVGSAMVFSMYRPIAEDDTEKICALMKLYRLYYRIIGGVILLAGLCLTPFLEKLINGSVPDGSNIYILYFLNLFATVLSYWLFAYRNSILQAHQRQDIYSKVTIVTNTIKYVLQFSALFLTRNYYFYLIIALALQVVNNVSLAYVSKKMYPECMPKGSLTKEEVKTLNQKIRDLFTSKLGYTIVHSADTIVISSFLGLRSLAQYQNYFFILNAIMGFVAIIYTSITAGIGNDMVVNDEETNCANFRVLLSVITWISGVCIACLLVMYQPFMRKWMGERMLLGFGLVILLCVYFWIYELVMLLSMYKDAAGVWHEDRYRPLISGLLNLGTNILLVRYIGLYGIVLSTILSMGLVSLPWVTINVSKWVLKKDFMVFLIQFLRSSVSICVTAGIVYLVCSCIPDSTWIWIIAKATITGVTAIVVMYLMMQRDEGFKMWSHRFLIKAR